MPVTTHRPERRHLRDRRQNAFPDLHERLENKRLAIEYERRHTLRRSADQMALPARPVATMGPSEQIELTSHRLIALLVTFVR